MIGTTVGHYQVINQLGAGGMGIVYEARDRRLGRRVALKFLPFHLSHNDHARQRFLVEARAASALNHPNVCTIYDIQEHHQQSFIVMECVDGENLQQRLGRGQLDIPAALDIAHQAALGLQAAHEQDVVHRDIKPANLMVTSSGHVKITDFGLAKLKNEAQITRVGSTVGTAAYMAPEQARGDAVDVRADIWALGVVLYEMLTGERPFNGQREAAVMYSVLHQEPAMPEALPLVVQRFLEKLLTKDPDQRYRSIDYVLSDLDAIRASYQARDADRDTDLSYETVGGLRYLDDQAPLVRYLELKAHIKRLEAELKELQPEILAALWEEPEHQTAFMGHKLTLQTRKSFAYSDRVTELKQALRDQKKREEANGMATLVKHTSFVVVREAKS